MLNEEGIRLKTGGFIPSEFELERDVQEELLSWKEKRHNTVLQIEGPRQVGKTHEVRKFAYSQYEQVIYVNLVRDEFGFEDCMAEEHFMQEYCEHAGLGDYVDNSNTILIIDEIQERQTVYNAIRDLRYYCKWKLFSENGTFQGFLSSSRNCLYTNASIIIS